MEMKELIKKTVAELQKLLEEKRKALSDFRFQIAGSKIKECQRGKKDKERDSTNTYCSKRS
jgi:ribosomal protein L29